MSSSRTSGVRSAAPAQTSDRSMGRSRPFAPPTSGGQSLDGATRAKMGERFGHDFSQVKIHTGTPAGQAADTLGAEAFTSGNDILFGEGAYTPGSESSERLLAHELTHVVQQDRYGSGSDSLKSRRSDPSEQEAERAADRVTAGESVDVQAAPRAAFSCFDPANNDVQNDFWNTKSMLGNKWGSVADSAMNTFWDVAGFAPGGSAVSAGIDLAKSGYSEGMSTLYGWEADLTGNTADRMRSKQYDEAAGSFLGDAGVDAAGNIPIFGQGQSAVGALWDGARTIDLATGGDPNGSPSFTDIQKQGVRETWNGINPPTPAVAPDPNQAPDPDQPPPNMPNDPFQGM